MVSTCSGGSRDPLGDRGRVGDPTPEQIKEGFACLQARTMAAPEYQEIAAKVLAQEH